MTKHAEATRVILRLGVTGDGELALTVQDNGRGFALEDAGAFVAVRHGNGLRHLRERLAGAGGQLEIHSRRGAGTTVKMSIRLGASDAGRNGSGVEGRPDGQGVGGRRGRAEL